MWNRPAPQGFQGLNPERPVEIYQRHLPHWRQEGATYFVTFRLADSLPQGKLRELEEMRQRWHQENPPPHGREQLEDLARETTVRVERWLDQGMGSCWLKEPEASKIVVGAMHHFDGERYELDCYVVMPNHVHVIVRPLLCAAHPLENILQSWKRHTSLQINRRFGLSGAVWQEESFDRIIRDEEHLDSTIRYNAGNPERAGLVRDSCPLWIRPEWEQAGWSLRRA